MSTPLKCNRLNIKSIDLMSIFLAIFSFISCFDVLIAEKILKCDFQKYPGIGCRYTTQVCDRNNQICKCGSKYPISLLNGICLEYKSINQSCMGSVQCNQTPNAGCFGLDTEFKDDFWILLWFRFGFTDPGKCDCDRSNGFEYNNSLKACVRTAIIGTRCATGWDCYSKVGNSLCGVNDRCQCRSGYYYDSESDSCKIQLNYDEHCISDEGCIGSSLVCVKSQCKCKPGFHFDKYKSSKCEPNNSNCPDNYEWNEGLEECVNPNIEIIKRDQNLNKLNELGLIEGPRIYSIFVILALWICLLFILGNAKRGLRLVEQAVRRDQGSQYRQCDTCTAQSIIETEDQEIGTSQMSIHSSVSSAITQNIPPPAFDELYPNDIPVLYSDDTVPMPYSDDPPTYEEVVQFDKQKTFVV